MPCDDDWRCPAASAADPILAPGHVLRQPLALLRVRRIALDAASAASSWSRMTADPHCRPANCCPENRRPVISTAIAGGHDHACILDCRSVQPPHPDSARPPDDHGSNHGAAPTSLAGHLKWVRNRISRVKAPVASIPKSPNGAAWAIDVSAPIADAAATAARRVSRIPFSSSWKCVLRPLFARKPGAWRRMVQAGTS